MKTIIQGPSLVVTISGELDHHSASEIRDKLDKSYERSGCRHIIFDFTEVSFMDSSGIGMIIGRYKNAGKKGGKVAVVNMNRQLEKVFSVSGLQKIVGQYATVQAAGQALCAEKIANKGGAGHGNQ
jgi:stage II sporulation protein AA (anti-sigma F factor antagonist)